MIGNIVLALLMLTSPCRATVVDCAFDTDGDGTPELVVPDADGDGFCDFPDYKTHLHGTLVFGVDQPVRLRGKPIIEADGIVVEPGGIIVGDPAELRSLTMVALQDDLIAFGTLAIHASDDLTLQSRAGSVDLLGPTVLAAADRLLLDARQGSVVILPTAFDPGGAFSVFGGNKVDLRAKGAAGSIDVGAAGIGGRTIRFDAGANLSTAAEKLVILGAGTVVTTDRGQTGLALTGDITLAASADVVITAAARVDSGRNIVVSTRRAGGGLCFAGGPTLQARDPLDRPGRIDFRGVRGPELEARPSADLDGLALRTGPVGACADGECLREDPAAAEPAGEAPQPAADQAAPQAEPTLADTFKAEHNMVRAAAKNNNPPPKKDTLKDLESDAVLAASAQFAATELAKTCACKHSSNAKLSDPKFVDNVHARLISPDPKVRAQVQGQLQIRDGSGKRLEPTSTERSGGRQAMKDILRGAESKGVPPPVLHDAQGNLVDAAGMKFPVDGNGDPIVGFTRTNPPSFTNPYGFARVGENFAQVINKKHGAKNEDGKYPFILDNGQKVPLSDNEMAKNAVAGWNGEQGNFNPKSAGEEKTAPRCKNGAVFAKGDPETCGHYSQMVWAKTTKVGCGIAPCVNDADHSIVVCQYLPRGNTRKETAYPLGP